MKLKKETDCKFSDFAILSRQQRDGFNVAQILASDGIPVKYTMESQRFKTLQMPKFCFHFLE